MEFSEVLKKRRSIRIFQQKEIGKETLLSLVQAAALAPSAANRQILRYAVVHSHEKVREIFELTAWGGHVRPHRNPEYGKTAPKAFIAVWTVLDAEGKLSPYAHTDCGAAIENMLLAAADSGLGSCWIGAFDHAKAEKILNLPAGSVLYLAAFGYPGEEPVSERITINGDTKYYLDGKNLLHVPKYAPEEISNFI